MLLKFYRIWLHMRFYSVVIATAILLIIAIQASCFVYDFEIRSPEWDQVEHDRRDQDNANAWDRCGTSEERDGDREKADNFEKDHLV
jgi:hypothetical protein